MLTNILYTLTTGIIVLSFMAGFATAHTAAYKLGFKDGAESLIIKALTLPTHKDQRHANL